MPASPARPSAQRPAVLVTGGAGFIGSHVADRFVALGWDVAVLDDLSSGRREYVPQAATFHHLDIRSAEARAVVAAGAFDAIVHLAAQMDVRKSIQDPHFDADVNIGGTLNLLAGALEGGAGAGRLPRFVFSSTGGAMYGDGVEIPSPESARAVPESPYGIAKLSVEHYLGVFHQLHGMETVALRFGNVYGPRQSPHGEAGVVAIFGAKLLAGEPLTVFGDGTATRDYVAVADVVEAIVLAATKPVPAGHAPWERAYNVGTGVETSVRALATAMARTAGVMLHLREAPARPGELQRSALDNAKLRAGFGWAPRVALEAGLAETINWIARQPSHAA